METTTRSNAHAAGPMERDEWRTALSELSDRLEPIERLQRLRAQSIVHIETQKLSSSMAKPESSTTTIAMHVRTWPMTGSLGHIGGLDDALNEVAKRVAERDLATENRSLRGNRRLQE